MEEEYFSFTGKTVEEAIETGLKELGLSKDDAEIVVEDEGKKKLFGSGKVKVNIKKKESGAENALESAPAPVETDKLSEDGAETDGARAVAFLKGLLEKMELSATPVLKSEGEKIVIEILSDRSSAVIGKRGTTLDALQTLAGAVANTGRKDYVRVVVDCENYRDGREETLKKLADNLAQKAVRLERKIRLEAMNPYDRRIIHAALSESEDVKTESEGQEPNRYVVIVPNNLSDPDLPAIPARDERRQNGGRGGRGGRGRGERRNGGKRDFGGSKPYNQKRSGMRTGSSSSSSPSSDFFGTFLGNSHDDE